MIRRVGKSTDTPPGAIREVRKFAWVPKTVGQFRIWLRHYEVLQVFRTELILGIDYDAPKEPNEKKEMQHPKITFEKKYWDTIDERI